MFRQQEEAAQQANHSVAALRCVLAGQPTASSTGVSATARALWVHASQLLKHFQPFERGNQAAEHLQGAIEGRQPWRAQRSRAGAGGASRRKPASAPPNFRVVSTRYHAAEQPGVACRHTVGGRSGSSACLARGEASQTAQILLPTVVRRVRSPYRAKPHSPQSTSPAWCGATAGPQIIQMHPRQRHRFSGAGAAEWP